MNPEHPRRVVLGVTSADSLILLRGLPARLAREGWDVHVVADRIPRDAFDGDDVPGTITVHALPMRREPAPGSDVRALTRWVVLLRRLRPSVVFVGTPKAGLLGLVAARLVRTPARIYHLRGLRLETSGGMQRRVLTTLERIALHASTSTIAVSRSLRDRVIAEGLAPASKIVVLGEGSSNGVDTEHFCPGPPDGAMAADLGLDPDVPVVGFVGRLTRDKGAPDLAAASVRLSQEGVAHQLLIVGPAEGSGAHTWFDAPRALGTRVVSTGRVGDSAPFYRLMSVLALPTLREGFPNVVLEASATGVPVVTTDATGAVDSVVDGRTGLIARAADASSFARCLERVLRASAAERRAMGAEGRRHVEATYARPVVHDRIVQHLAQQSSPVGVRTGSA